MSTTPEKTPPRVDSLDAYRGFVMFLMMAEVLRLREVARALPGSEFWQFLARHQTHVDWGGLTLHDLIQPSFSFLVGVALPFSIAARVSKGHTFRRMLLHALWRAVALTLLGVFLRSSGHPQTRFTFIDTLSQIGMGYVFLFLLGFVQIRWQILAAVLILVADWAAFALYPAPGADFTYPHVPSNWPHHYSGFASHWNKNGNLGWRFDTWFLNLFPLEPGADPVRDMGGYATLNFIPTLATMTLGLVAGGWLRLSATKPKQVLWLLSAGAVCYACGWALDRYGICPSVKHLWTPAWVLVSGGWCFALLAGFYAVIDGLGLRFPFFPFVVIGANSIAAYCMAHWFNGDVAQNLKTHLYNFLGENPFALFGAAYEPLVRGLLVLAVYWLILLWMYRNRVFVRL